MKLLILSVWLAATAAAPSDLWQVFQASYAKVYSLQEIPYRQKLFLEQVEFVRKHNEEADLGLHTYRVGINEFSDWSQEEYETLLLGDRADETGIEEEIVTEPLPASVDWRTKGKVTRVKNQAGCGSCWAFAASGALETSCAIKKKKLNSLSEQQMVDCSRAYGNKGCDGGFHHRTYDYIKDCGGSVLEDRYRYTAKEGLCRFNSVKQYVVCKCVGKKQAKGEAALARETAVSAVSVSIDASRRGFRNYKNGVYRDAGCNKIRSNHAVVSVGYGSNYWIIKNSWGSRWGNRGYINMYRGDNNCGIGNRAYRPIV